jgi:hypothetical protein
MQAEQRENKKQAPLRAAKPKPESETLSAEEGRVSILPIEDETVAAGEGVPVIGKDKVQVEEALKKAQEVREEERAKVTARPVTF